MLSLIVATAETISEPPGDSLMTLALALAGLAMIVTAIATVIVTPKADSHHD